MQRYLHDNFGTPAPLEVRWQPGDRVRLPPQYGGGSATVESVAHAADPVQYHVREHDGAQRARLVAQADLRAAADGADAAGAAP